MTRRIFGRQSEIFVERKLLVVLYRGQFDQVTERFPSPILVQIQLDSCKTVNDVMAQAGLLGKAAELDKVGGTSEADLPTPWPEFREFRVFDWATFAELGRNTRVDEIPNPGILLILLDHPVDKLRFLLNVIKDWSRTTSGYSPDFRLWLDSPESKFSLSRKESRKTVVLRGLLKGIPYVGPAISALIFGKD